MSTWVQLRALDGILSEGCPGALPVESSKTLKGAQTGPKIWFSFAKEGGWEGVNKAPHSK